MSRERYIGFAEETTFGTAVAAGDTIEPESEDIGPSGDQALVFEGVSGVPRIVKPGPYGVEGSFTALLDLDATPLFWKLLLGSSSDSGASPDITHLFTLDRPVELPSATFRVGREQYEHVFVGCAVDGLTLEFSRDDLAKLTVDIVGQKDEKDTLATPVSYTSGEVFAGHEITMSIGGNDESAEVESGSISVVTNADADEGRSIGSRFTRRIHPGAIEIAVDLDLAFLDTDHLERFWGAASGPVTGAGSELTEFDVVLNLGNNYDITLPRCVQPDVGLTIDGPDRISQSASFVAVVDSSTGEIIEVSVTNDVTTY